MLYRKKINRKKLIQNKNKNKLEKYICAPDVFDKRLKKAKLQFFLTR